MHAFLPTRAPYAERRLRLDALCISNTSEISMHEEEYRDRVCTWGQIHPTDSAILIIDIAIAEKVILV